MFSSRMLTLACLAAGFAADTANAVQITFDDMNAGTGIPIQNGYSGMDWGQFYVADAALADPGYRNAVVSTPNVAYNLIGVSATIGNSNGFNLVSGYFTAPYSNATVNVTTTGGSGQQLSFPIHNSGPTLVTFDFYGIRSATFSVTGSSANFAVDNLTVTAVPEPEQWVLMLAGIGWVGYRVLRSKATIVSGG